MQVSDIQKHERIIDSEGQGVTVGDFDDIMKIWFGLSERTPAALWTAVDDSWRTRLVRDDNLISPITPADLFATAQEFELLSHELLAKARQLSRLVKKHATDAAIKNFRREMQAYSPRMQHFFNRELEKMLSTRRRPGQSPLTPEEKIDIYHAWEKSGLTQIEFCDRRIRNVSRSTLQRIVKWYETQQNE